MPATSAPNAGFQPEDLTILIPARQEGSSAFAVETIDELQRFFVPLTAVMSKAFYVSLFDELGRATFSRPIGGQLLQESSFLDVPQFRRQEQAHERDIEDWFITGLRFRPCVSPLPVPQSWLEDEDLRVKVCRPRVQLSVQRFGFVGNRVTSDDKSLHLIYDFVGSNADEGVNVPVEQAERAATDELSAALATDEGLSRDALLTIVHRHYTDDVTETLRLTRRLMLDRVVSLNGETRGGRLSPDYSDLHKLARFKEYIATSLSHEALPALVTAAFADLSYRPATRLTWVFSRFEVPRTANGLFFGRAEIRHLTPSVEVGDVAYSMDLGNFEVFSDVPSSGVDPDFDQALTDLAELLESRGIGGQEIDAWVGAVLIDSAMVRYQNLDPIPPDDDRTYRVVNSPELHGSASPSCVSCHLVTGQRERFGIDSDRLGVYRILGNRPISLRDIGPIAQALPDQVTGGFKQTWNLRAFGYYGDAPSISDRVIVETNRDIVDANAILGSR